MSLLQRRSMLRQEEEEMVWTTDGIADLSEPNGDLEISVVTIGAYAFRGCGGITSVSAPSARLISAFAFYGCKNLKSAYIPEVKNYGQMCFSATSIEELIIPNVVSIGYSAFSTMQTLKKIDLGENLNKIISAAFLNTPELSTIILRNPDGVPLENVNAFNSSRFASGGVGGEIYIPQTLIDSGYYTSAVNWSTVNGYGTITWKAIEGSEYENIV